MKDRILEIKREVKEVLTKTVKFMVDRPQNLKDMDRRFQDIHWGYKVAGIATEVALITSGCQPVAPTISSEQDNTNRSNTSEYNPAKESEMYTASFQWLPKEDKTIQNVAKEKNVNINNVSGYKITIRGAATANGEIDAVFTQFRDETGFYAGIHSSEFEAGVAPMVFNTVEVDGITLIQKGYYEASGDFRKVLEYSANASKKLVLGQKVNVTFYPTPNQEESLPSLDRKKGIKVTISPRTDLPRNGTNEYYASMMTPVTVDISTDNGTQPAPEEPESQLPEGLKKFAEQLKGSYEFEKKGERYVLIDAKTKQEVPEISFDKTGNWIRMENFTEEGYESKVLKIYGNQEDIKVLDQEDDKILYFSSWKVENGQWVRTNVINIDPKGVVYETEKYQYSKEEIIEMLRQDSAKVAKKVGEKEWLNINTWTRRVSKARAFEVLGFDGISQSVRYDGEQYAAKWWAWDNAIYFIDITGNLIPIQNDIFPFKFERTIFYAYTALPATGQTDIRWTDVDGNKKEFIAGELFAKFDSKTKTNGLIIYEE